MVGPEAAAEAGAPATNTSAARPARTLLGTTPCWPSARRVVKASAPVRAPLGTEPAAGLAYTSRKREAATAEPTAPTSMPTTSTRITTRLNCDELTWSAARSGILGITRSFHRKLTP